MSLLTGDRNLRPREHEANARENSNRSYGSTANPHYPSPFIVVELDVLSNCALQKSRGSESAAAADEMSSRLPSFEPLRPASQGALCDNLTQLSDGSQVDRKNLAGGDHSTLAPTLQMANRPTAIGGYPPLRRHLG